MRPRTNPEGWAWLEPGATQDDEEAHRLARAFAACFAGADGALAQAHLERVFLDRRLGPRASDAELRHLEGQRSVVAHIRTLVARGRAGAPHA